MADVDAHALERFVQAQNENGTFERALAELARGHKTTHWIWFVFPQISGLGRSATAQYFAVASRAEALAYLDHPVLGPRLRQAAAVIAEADPPVEAILGDVDSLKLRSSMTLFMRVGPDEPVFRRVLDRHYGGIGDAATDQLL